MSTEIVNGVRVHYGPRTVEKKAPSLSTREGETVELVAEFDYLNLPAADDNGDAVVLQIPANSLIKSADLYISTDFDSTSGTTTISTGLQQTDGTEIDNDGLVAAITADGSNAGWTVGAGALVGASTGADAGQLVVTASAADLTAGAAKLVVHYIKA